MSPSLDFILNVIVEFHPPAPQQLTQLTPQPSPPAISPINATVTCYNIYKQSCNLIFTEVNLMCLFLFSSNSEEKINERERKWREEELEEEYDEIDGIEDADY